MLFILCERLLLASSTIYLREKQGYHGFIGVASSLELNGSEGVRWAELGVLADAPLLRLDVIASEPGLIFLTLSRGGAWRLPNVLACQTPTATPMAVNKHKNQVTCVHKLNRGTNHKKNRTPFQLADSFPEAFMYGSNTAHKLPFFFPLSCLLWTLLCFKNIMLCPKYAQNEIK